MPSNPRNYKSEYQNYQGTSAQKKRRAARNAARRKLMKTGRVTKGDGKDVGHSNGNPKDNKAKNLKVQTKKANRSYARTKTARKKNRKS